MTFVDAHCHLFREYFGDELDAVFARAHDAGVRAFVVPATNLATATEAADLAAGRAGVYTAAGVHPHDASDFGDAELAALERHLDAHPCVAVGEIGLDYHYDFCPRDRQIDALRRQLAVAVRRGLPVVLHNRESDDDLLEACRAHQDGSLRGQFHCFSSTVDYARRVLDLGFHISFTGNVTFRRSALDDVLRFVPDDRLLIETDSPYMAPVPHRGTQNEPMRVPLIAERFAAARGTSAAHIARITTENAVRLFGLSVPKGNTDPA